MNITTHELTQFIDLLDIVTPRFCSWQEFQQHYRRGDDDCRRVLYKTNPPCTYAYELEGGQSWQ